MGFNDFLDTASAVEFGVRCAHDAEKRPSCDMAGTLADTLAQTRENLRKALERNERYSARITELQDELKAVKEELSKTKERLAAYDAEKQ